MTTTFETWLKTNHYRESTVKASLRGLGALRRAYDSGAELPESCRYTAQRVLSYHSSMKERSELKPAFASWLRDQGAAEVKSLPKAKPKKRKLEARSFYEPDWKRLRAKLAQSNDRRDQVLYVILMTGLRVGDILRTPRVEIERAVRSGVIEIERKGGSFIQVPIKGLEAPWATLAEEMKSAKASTIAAYVRPRNPSPMAGDAAYKALSRRLKELGAKFDVQGRLHLHRLRRTIAVRGLEKTKDLVAVQQLLAHASINSTQRYTDEIRTNAVAETRRIIHDD